MLGEIPISAEVRKSSDSGIQIIISEPQSIQSKSYRNIAKNLIKSLTEFSNEYLCIQPNFNNCLLHPIILGISIPFERLMFFSILAFLPEVLIMTCIKSPILVPMPEHILYTKSFLPLH